MAGDRLTVFLSGSTTHPFVCSSALPLTGVIDAALVVDRKHARSICSMCVRFLQKSGVLITARHDRRSFLSRARFFLNTTNDGAKPRTTERNHERPRKTTNEIKRKHHNAKRCGFAYSFFYEPQTVHGLHSSSSALPSAASTLYCPAGHAVTHVCRSSVLLPGQLS